MSYPIPTDPPRDPPATDGDLAVQARPGFGVPSQDPRPAAQQPLSPQEADREGASALMGGALVAGAALGAALGVLVAGPLGVVVGGTLGAVAGAVGGAAGGPAVGHRVDAAARRMEASLRH